MKRTHPILALVAALAACATPGPPAPPANPAAAGKFAPSTAPKPPQSEESMGIEARIVLGKTGTPAPPSQASLKARYPDKAAFLADVQAVKPVMAVELDGKLIATGFGPALRYRTADDGSVGSP